MHKKIVGIIGHPVAHSLSPLMHNSAAKITGMDIVYVAMDVLPENLKKGVDGIRALGIYGVNVTVPHKEKVVKLMDEVDAEASLIGAVNTITLKNGRLHGANTDGRGFLRSLDAEGFCASGKRAAVIGAGGSARAVGVSLLRAGVSGLTIINRTPSHGRLLARRLAELGEVSFVPAGSVKAGAVIEECDLVVQTTPCGMRRRDPLPVKSAKFRPGQYAYDIIYSPIETRFLKNARLKGARTINGLGMLVYQGSESFKIWTGRPFPEKKILALLKRSVARGT